MTLPNTNQVGFTVNTTGSVAQIVTGNTNIGTLPLNIGIWLCGWQADVTFAYPVTIAYLILGFSVSSSTIPVYSQTVISNTISFTSTNTTTGTTMPYSGSYIIFNSSAGPTTLYFQCYASLTAGTAHPSIPTFTLSATRIA